MIRILAIGVLSVAFGVACKTAELVEHGDSSVRDESTASRPIEPQDVYIGATDSEDSIQALLYSTLSSPQAASNHGVTKSGEQYTLAEGSRSPFKLSCNRLQAIDRTFMIECELKTATWPSFTPAISRALFQLLGDGNPSFEKVSGNGKLACQTVENAPVCSIPTIRRAEVTVSEPITRVATQPGDNAVADPSTPFLTKLPNGDQHLASYRAAEDLQTAYQRDLGQEKWDQLHEHVAWLKTDTRVRSKYERCSLIELVAMAEYTKDGYTTTNGALRKIRNGLQIELTADVERKILMYASAINCLPQKKTRAIRGVKTLPIEVIATYVPGTFVREWPFTSTSQGSDINEMFAGEVEFRYGKVSGANLQDVSVFQGEESEILINAGAVFKVRKNYKRGATYVIELDQVIAE